MGLIIYYVLVHLAVLVMLFPPSYESKQTYTSSTICRRGNNQTSFYKASCKDKVTNVSQDVEIIAVTKVLYGAKPISSECALNGSAAECCSHVPDQDCLTEPASGGYLSSIAEDCSGAKSCEAVGRTIDASTYCPSAGNQFEGDTTYSMFEYQCINLGLLENMCHEGVIQQGEEIYLASNIYFQNKDEDDDCFCKLSTTCGSRVVFEAVDIRLSRIHGGGCGESILFSDVRDPDHNHTVTCYDRYLQMKPVFETHSNIGSVDMRIKDDEKNLGYVWIRVTSSSKNATVRLYCGLTANSPITEEHLCEEDKSTSQISTTSTKATTTTTHEPTTSLPDCRVFPELCEEHPAQQTGTIGIGAIVGIVIAGVVLLFILFILLVLLMRRYYCGNPDNHPYDNTVVYDNDYETLHPPDSKELPAFENNSYISNGHATGDTVEEDPPAGYAHYITPVNEYDDIDEKPHYDNLGNEEPHYNSLRNEKPHYDNLRNEAIASDLDQPNSQKTSL
ncbi:uncharacterized protein LOC121372102 [Gigantopelta aegis]|uniref:uncharacterized protein LOC121372102 n=1 Tax=Gigantopelta aegis TaxID=1735272 RepID=UPI001B88B264|nr:uncharacterized protein LOC121372102 [Gigantopelta aegis]